jgi:hypothetical protein
MKCTIETEVFDADEVYPVKTGWYFCILNDGTPIRSYFSDHTFWNNDSEEAVSIYHKKTQCIDGKLLELTFVKYWGKLPVAKVEESVSLT